ncbi:NADH-quinone oxidoreductase subunit H [Edaphobacter acidisoli]|uniref:NADH-quinone oxidoreductase subunit H n=1 Tax=Edaphobacter acidisoli TaxID=2040573 RepID=A0A916RQJ3_9BACT|nr:NADH-quinone oxidoreductase subunit NuoH [Edaphobacter acidisoli]GGA65487.1 NADH-quinone oxidoreductase subunit H [Edaphobacter acidisoli]
MILSSTITTAQAADQLFVSAERWLVSHTPAAVEPLVADIISAAALLVVFASLFAITTVLERKGLGRIQNRYGPNRVGPFGILQPLADGIKSLTKEDIVPLAADKTVHFLAPIVLVVAAFTMYAVLPIGRNMVLANLDAGILFFFAASSVMEMCIFMAGWSSNNKYSLLGAMRAIAQMISYEVPLILAAVTVVMAAGSLSTVTIIEKQSGFTGILPHWFILTPWGFAGFVLFMIAATAESNRSPFDLPEGESEIISGYFTEYSGFKFALFFLGEYIGMFAMSGLGITLFLGGWGAPLSFLTWVPSYIWFFAKLLFLIAMFIWIRGTLPRLRMDQLMNFAWKFMLPLALINLVTAGVWRFVPNIALRWLICALMVVVPYVLLGRGMAKGWKLEKRTYRFAE